jgi:type-F conjugative transfer system pilin assembly protein TrbC
VPVETIRTYVRDLDLLADPNIVMALRGFVAGMRTVQPTIGFIESLLVKEKSCKNTVQKECDIHRVNIQIDPLVFRKFGIEQVPAFVYVKGAILQDDKLSIGNKNNLHPQATHSILFGDISLNYVLERFAEESGSDYLKAMADKLNSGGNS